MIGVKRTSLVVGALLVVAHLSIVARLVFWAGPCSGMQECVAPTPALSIPEQLPLISLPNKDQIPAVVLPLGHKDCHCQCTYNHAPLSGGAILASSSPKQRTCQLVGPPSLTPARAALGTTSGLVRGRFPCSPSGFANPVLLALRTVIIRT